MTETTQKKTVKEKCVDLYHIDNPALINKSASKILGKVTELAAIYRKNKNGKVMTNATLRTEDFEKVSRSVNSALSKTEFIRIKTSRLIYQGIVIAPERLAA